MTPENNPNYNKAAETIRNRGLLFIEKFNSYLSNRFGTEIDSREFFLLDGSGVVSQDFFETLPDSIRYFLINGRISMPQALHAFQSGYRHDQSEMTVSVKTSHVALRGERFYVYDGKYNFGPDEIPALNILCNNIIEDTDILSQAKELPLNTPEEWILKTGVWDYIRNDLSSAYYLKRCQHVLEPRSGDTEITEIYERALYLASDGYYSSLLARPTHINIEELSQLMTYIHKDLADTDKFIEENAHLDLLRSHRELGMPQSILMASHIIFNTNKLDNTDILVAPLFGAIDVATAFEYMRNNGDEIYEEIMMFKPEKKIRIPQVVKVLTKISPRGAPRSIRPGANDAIPQSREVIEYESAQVREKIAEAKNKILIIEDSVSTRKSYDKVAAWIRAITQEPQIDFVAAHASIRWAEGNNSPILPMVDSETIALTPLSHRFKKPIYSWGSGYMPDKEITSRLLLTTRTIKDLEELIPLITKGYKDNTIEGIGFDLFNTLIERTDSKEEQREKINKIANKSFSEFGINIEENEYIKSLEEVIEQKQQEHSHTDEEADYFFTITQSVEKTLLNHQIQFDYRLIEAIASLIFNKEMEYQKSIIRPSNSAINVLSELNRIKIPVGIYENTSYPRDDVLQIINKTGILLYIPVENILLSVDRGISKPDPRTIEILAAVLKVKTTRLAYVGNSKKDLYACANARAIPILKLVNGEHPGLENRINNWRKFLERTS